MCDISSNTIPLTLANGLKLFVEILPFKPDVRLRAEFDVIVHKLVAVVLRAALMLSVLSIPTIHAFS
jgi:hypothetical protein